MPECDVTPTRAAHDPQLTRRLIETLSAAVIGHARELTDLDRAIGDGDHGINLMRGFAAVSARIDELAALSIGAALHAIGGVLVMNVGGASGPLYGTFFLVIGERLSLAPALSRDEVIDACEAAVAAVRARGRSEVGQKTLLDVLVPVAGDLRAGGERVLSRLAERAACAAAATVPMRALRGRAAYLGERSVGHMDPGARSTQLLIAAACASFESLGFAS